MKLPLAGGCLCDAIRYRISAEPRSADYCHCRMCRRAAGAPVVARLTVANQSFAWITGEPRSTAPHKARSACSVQTAALSSPSATSPITWT
jgi:hypothetical protein